MAVLLSQNIYPFCRVGSSVNITLTSGAEQYLSWDTDIADPWGMHDVLTNPTRLTCLVPGNYLIQGFASFVASATGVRYMRIRLNGVTSLAKQQYTSFGASGAPAFAVTCMYPLSAGDYVECSAFQDSGAPLDLTSVIPGQPAFAAARLPG